MNQRTGGFLGLELKFFDNKRPNVTLAASNDASSGELDPAADDCLNAIKEGPGQQQRIGRKCVLKSIHVTGQVESDGIDLTGVGLRKAYFFIALVLDTQTNGATLDSEDVFTNLAADADLSASPARNIEHQSRFKILKSVRLSQPVSSVITDGAVTGSVSGYQIPFTLNAKMNLPVNFVSVDGGIASIVDNSVHLIGWASNTEMAPKVTYGSRVRFLG